MMKCKGRWILTPVAMWIALGACSLQVGGAGTPADEPVDSEVAVATFDTVWHIVLDRHYDPDLGGVDWALAGDTLRPKAATARSRSELRNVLSMLLAQLGESHFAVIPERVTQEINQRPGGEGGPGLRVDLIEDEIVVLSVDPDGPAERAGVRPGDVVVSVDGTPVMERVAPVIEALVESPSRWYVAQAVALHPLHGPVGESRSIELDRTEGGRDTVTLVLEEPRGEPMTLGPLHLHGHLEHERIHTPAGALGYIRFNGFFPTLLARFDRAVDEFRDAAGIVIDMRGNGGGDIRMGGAIAGHFVDSHEPLGVMRPRGGETRLVAMPRRLDTSGQRVAPFLGPVAVLVDGACASMCEILAGGMQTIGRAQVVGSRTAGLVLPSLFRPLPTGDVLQHATADFHLPDGRRLEGEGLEPDVHVRPTRAELAAGRDPVLEAAIEWIASTEMAGDGSASPAD